MNSEQLKKINEIDNKMSECEKEIDRLKIRIKELGLEKAELEYSEKFPIGRDLLLKGCKYRIVGYKYSYESEVEVCKYKKDGNLSERKRTLWGSEERTAVLI
jgi:hypothetical protein